MATKKRLEDCKTEAEEVRWFEDNQDLLLKKFKQAAAKGKLIPGLDREETMAGAAPAPRRRAC
jgi:hypothetical protein